MKAKNSFLGRVLRRLFGEETGAVMMEYIVVALLIAAVAVVAISAFGNAASGLFGVLTDSIRGATTDAKTKLAQVHNNAISDNENAVNHANTMLADDDSKEQSNVSTLQIPGN